MSAKTDYYVYEYRDYKGTVRYIGKGRNDRIRQHILAAKKLIHDPAYKPKTNPFVRWLALQIRKERHFTFTKLHEGLTEKEAFERETSLIQKIGRAHQKTGPLLNILDTGGMSSEQAKALWQRHRSKIINGIQKSERAKTWLRQLATDPEIRQKRAQAIQRRWENPTLRAETTQKIRAAHSTPKTKKNVLAAAQKRTRSEDWKQKHRAAMQRTAKTRAAKIRQAWAKPGNKMGSPETNAKRRAGLLAAWAQPNSKTRSPEALANRRAGIRAAAARRRTQTFNDPRQLRLLDDDQ